MPYGIKKTKKGCYSVYNKKTKRVFSKCTSKKRAQKQSKLLRAIMYNPNFQPRNRTVKKIRKNS